MIEVRDARHEELGRKHQVANVDRLGGYAKLGARIRGHERLEVVVVAVDRLNGEHRGGAVRDRAHATDALHEGDRIVGVAADQEVLKATPQVTVYVRLGDETGCAGGELNAKVTFNTGNRVYLDGSADKICHLLSSSLF